MWIRFRFFPACKSKSIVGCFTHQAGMFGVKCFSKCCGLILVDSKSCEILMPNDLKVQASVHINQHILVGM